MQVETKIYIKLTVRLEHPSGHITSSYFFDHNGKLLPNGSREKFATTLDRYERSQLEACFRGEDATPSLRYLYKRILAIGCSKIVETQLIAEMGEIRNPAGAIINSDWEITHSVTVVEITVPPKSWTTGQPRQQLRIRDLKEKDLFILRSDGQKYVVCKKQGAGWFIITPVDVNGVPTEMFKRIFGTCQVETVF